MTPCTNCGEAAADLFCARCGEQQPGHHDLSLRHFAQHTLHELVHLDSKLFLTLKELVARPGFVPQEYFAGRKTRYIPPLRFFLTSSRSSSSPSPSTGRPRCTASRRSSGSTRTAR